MMRALLFSALTVAMAFTVACGTRKGATDGVTVGDAGADDSVMARDMSADSALKNSDSNTLGNMSTINFEFDTANLTMEAKQLLKGNAEWLRQNPTAAIQVEGHCDSRGSVEYNLALGERRAKSVKNYLTSMGINPERMSIISYGKEKPIAIGESEEAWAKNRRANFVELND